MMWPMDKSIVYNIASNALSRARDLQSQISQIELDIKYCQLNNQSSFGKMNDMGSIGYLQGLKANRIQERDSHLSEAISYAVEIMIDDIMRHVSGYLSLGAMMIANIQSFLSIYDVKVHVSAVTRYKLAELSYKLALPSFSYLEVATKVENLKSHIY